MTSQPILNSPFLTHSVLDTLLSQPDKSPAERIQLLSARIHLYSNPPDGHAVQPPTTSTDSSSSMSVPSVTSTPAAEGRRRIGDEARIPEMRTRLDLAKLQREEHPTMGALAGARQAEAPLRIVLDWTKGAIKGIERREKLPESSRGFDDGNERGEDGIPASATRRGADAVSTASNLPGDSYIRSASGISEQVVEIRKEALGMMIEVEKLYGRSSRVDVLQRQLSELDQTYVES